MRKLILAVMLTVFTFATAGCTTGSNKQLTQNEKIDDFEYMYTILKENYPYFKVNKRLNGIDWLSKKNEYISKIKATANDEDYFNALQNILSDLKNGHVAVMNKNFYYYAKNVFESNGKLTEAWLKQLNNPKAEARYSSMPDKGNKSPLNANSPTPNNVTLRILKSKEAAYISIGSFNTLNVEGDMKIIKPFLQEVKNYKTLVIDIRGNGGGDSRYWSDNIVPMLINKPIDDTQYVAYRGGSFTEEFIKSKNGFGYEKLKPISNISKENLKELPPELEKDFKYYKKDTIHYEPKNSIGFNGKIYLLVDGSVFSSSEAFAVFAKSTGFATLVGETTGGDGIGDDPAICVLPNSGYAFTFSKQMGLTSDGTCNFEHKTEPDIRVPAVKNSSLSNDEAVRAVLKLVR